MAIRIKVFFFFFGFFLSFRFSSKVKQKPWKLDMDGECYCLKMNRGKLARSGQLGKKIVRILTVFLILNRQNNNFHKIGIHGARHPGYKHYICFTPLLQSLSET